MERNDNTVCQNLAIRSFKMLAHHLIQPQSLNMPAQIENQEPEIKVTDQLKKKEKELKEFKEIWEQESINLKNDLSLIKRSIMIAIIESIECDSKRLLTLKRFQNSRYKNEKVKTLFTLLNNFLSQHSMDIFIDAKKNKKDLRAVLKKCQEDFCVFVENKNAESLSIVSQVASRIPLLIEKTILDDSLCDRYDIDIENTFCAQCGKRFFCDEKVIIFVAEFDSEVIKIAHLEGDCGLAYKQTRLSTKQEKQDIKTTVSFLLRNKIKVRSKHNIIQIIQKKEISVLKNISKL